jgi:TRAP transporter TAXI family solute receptor
MKVSFRAIPAIYIWIAVIFLAAITALSVLIPKPPDTILLTTGGEKGLYYRFGTQLAQELEKEQLILKVLPSAGSAENLSRLSDRAQKTDLALLQGGVGSPEKNQNIAGLAAVFDEQIWIFYRRQAFKEPPNQIGHLKNKRISMSLPGSGTRVLGLQLLGLGGLQVEGEGKNVEVFDLDARDSLKSLLGKSLDAALLVAGPQTPIISEYLDAADLGLMQLAHADALALRLPFLKVTALPRGSINLARDLPRTDTKLLAATAALVAHEDIHPALITPLLRATDNALRKMELLQAEGEFPSASGFTWPLHEDAREYLKEGPSFLYRHLPFWGAVWVDRAIRFVLPLLVVVLPLMSYLPAAIKASVDARLSNFYRQLRDLERRLSSDSSLDWERELEAIEQKVISLKVPKKYAFEVYNLRMHISLVRQQLKLKGAV